MVGTASVGYGGFGLSRPALFRFSSTTSIGKPLNSNLTLFSSGFENYLDGWGGESSAHFSAKKRALYGKKWVNKLYSMTI